MNSFIRNTVAVTLILAVVPLAWAHCDAETYMNWRCFVIAGSMDAELASGVVCNENMSLEEIYQALQPSYQAQYRAWREQQLRQPLDVEILPHVVNVLKTSAE